MSGARLNRPLADDKRRQFERLLDRYGTRGYKIACHVVGDHFQAEEIEAEARMNACRAFSGFIASGDEYWSFVAWMDRIILNRCINEQLNYHRTRSKNLSLEVIIDVKAPPAADFDPFLYLQAQEKRQVIKNALSQIPKDFHLVIELFYWEDCDYKEIARKLNCPLGTVRSRLHRAKDYLKVVLGSTELFDKLNC
jgi:RNA polymerase sigma-70 factor (ECF subfamily)